MLPQAKGALPPQHIRTLGQHFHGGLGDLQFLVGGDDEDLDLAVGGGDGAGTGLAGAVFFQVQAHAQFFQTFADLGADDVVVFTDTGGEDQGIDLAAQQEEVGAQGLLDAADQHVEGQFGLLVAVLDLLVHVTHVGEAAQAQQAGLLVHQGVHFLGGQALLFHDEGDDGRVDGTAAGAHDEAFQGGEAHAGVKALAVFHTAHGRAVAEVHGDGAQLGLGLAQVFGGLLGDVLVRGAVEAVAADLILGVPAVGHGIDVGLGGHGLVEGGVEDGHHGGVGHDLLAGLDAGDVGGVVEGGQGDALPDAVHDLAVDDDGVGELLAAVDHTVADGIDLGHVLDDAIVVVGQHLHDQLDGGLVVGHVAVGVIDVLAGGGVLDVAVDADALAQALGQHFLGIGVEQLILQRRAACVDHQNFHGIFHSLFLHRIHNACLSAPVGGKIVHTHLY